VILQRRHLAGILWRSDMSELQINDAHLRPIADKVFAGERQKLEQQWGHSENVSTEDFRVALRRYRSFFARLLAI